MGREQRLSPTLPTLLPKPPPPQTRAADYLQQLHKHNETRGREQNEGVHGRRNKPVNLVKRNLTIQKQQNNYIHGIENCRKEILRN